MKQDRIWEFYQTEASDLFSENEGRLEAVLRHIPPKSRVLDIGVGSGFFEAEALRAGHEVWGIDPSEETIIKLKGRFPAIASNLFAGRAEALPFEDSFFDVVVASEVLEHLDEEIGGLALTQIVRVLKPGGLFIGTVPAREDLLKSRVVCPDCGKQFHRWGHARSFAPSDISEMLHRHHLSPESITERKFITLRQRRGLGFLVALLRLALPYFGIRQDNESLLFVGAKQ